MKQWTRLQIDGEAKDFRQLSKRLKADYNEFQKNHEDSVYRESKWLLVTPTRFNLYLQILRYNKKMNV